MTVISRRNMLVGTGGLMLAGCDRIVASPTVKQVLTLGEKATRSTQRLISDRNALAQEFGRADISPVFKENGTKRPQGDAYAAHVANGFADWRLVVDGLMAQPMALSLPQILAAPSRTQITRHDCVEGWSAIGEWTGLPLGLLLKQAQLSTNARFIVFHCADTLFGKPYYESIDLIDAFHPQTILAHSLNRQRLGIGHGAPLRLRVERQLGYKQAKYVMRIEAVASLDRLHGGKGGFWEDRSGYQWYAGI